MAMLERRLDIQMNKVSEDIDTHIKAKESLQGKA